MIAADQPLHPFGNNLVNLADARLGAEAIFATDDFFAPKDRMLNPEPAMFIPGKYDEHGKWMDGWESRRKRGEGHDYCIVKLGLPGIIAGFDIDTSHFTGNYPPAASIEACRITGDPTPNTSWTEIVPATSLKGNSHHFVAVSDANAWTHLRLNIFPDGGVARLRAYGRVAVDWNGYDAKELVDLAGVVHGGYAIACSDQHYGSPMQVLYPGRGINMGDGWETRRRREPGNDWALFALGNRGRIRKIEIDTAHFKGNYPDRCSIQAADVKGGTEQSLVTQSMFWRTLLPEQKLEMDRPHTFQKEISDLGPVTHVRLNIIPDGGISRMRLFGERA
jgi:allantoicase